MRGIVDGGSSGNSLTIGRSLLGGGSHFARYGGGSGPSGSRLPGSGS